MRYNILVIYYNNKYKHNIQEGSFGGGGFFMLKLVTKRCKGCGICVNFCPKKVLEVTEVGKCAIIKDKEKDCIQCGQCEMRCPDYAIFVEKE